jgi:hypothetical protein
MPGISSINPLPQEDNQKAERMEQMRRIDRKSLGLEIINDESIGRAISIGAERYEAKLRESIDRIEEQGEIARSKRTLRNIQILRSILTPEAKIGRDGLEKRAERMHITVTGENEAYVILGQQIPRNGEVAKQLEIRARYLSPNAINEVELSKAYNGGQSAEKVFLNSDRARTSRNTPIGLSVVVKDAVFNEKQGKIESLDTTGIALSMDETGQIIEGRGMTFKLGYPHYTDNLLSDEDLTALEKAGEVIPTIQEFVR